MLYKKKQFVANTQRLLGLSQLVDKEVVTFTRMFLKADIGTKANCEEQEPGAG